jgi:diaminopimelate epimerase
MTGDQVAPISIAKAHAYGNDFLYVRREAVEAAALDPARLAVAVCERRTGIGADGLIVFSELPDGARMRLINPDGSHAEVSGNGVRALGALLARRRGWHSGAETGQWLTIETDAGPKRLCLIDVVNPSRFIFRAEMGTPRDIRAIALDVAGQHVEAVRLDMGNPQCVVFGRLDEDRLAKLGRALQTHPAFPQAVNFELAEVAGRTHVRILIWERGAGRTESSGTGSCAAAVAAMTAGLTDRAVDVEAPGGTQRVEWTTSGVLLTGWAEVVCEGTWIGDLTAAARARQR